MKLEKILDYAKVNVVEKVCIDIGASTGGFTHCLLLRGAKKIFAIDSGKDQLDPSIKHNENVISIEGYNARNISLEDVGELVDIITIDVSFISQTLILPKAVDLIKKDGIYLSLIKPQFEVGKSLIGKGGIVKNKKASLLAVENVIKCANACSFHCYALTKSPILGGDGNVEFLAAFKRDCNDLSVEEIKNIVLNS